MSRLLWWGRAVRVRFKRAGLLLIVAAWLLQCSTFFLCIESDTSIESDTLAPFRLLLWGFGVRPAGMGSFYRGLAPANTVLV